jgi:membrane protein
MTTPPAEHRSQHSGGSGDSLKDSVSDGLEDGVGRVRERLPPFVNELIDRLREAEVLFSGAGLAFYGLISLAPTLTVGFWVVGNLVGEDRVSSLAENLADMAPGEADVEPVVQNLLEVGTGVGLVALATALWPATAYGSGLIRAFDEISPEGDRPVKGLRGRVKSLALLVGLPVLLLGALGTSYLLPGMVEDGPVMTFVAWAGALIAGTVVTASAITGIYLLFGPDSLSWRSFALSALGAALAIAVMSSGYLVYLDQGADWEERVAGTGLAALVLLGLWLYLTNIILLTGYAAALAHHERASGNSEYAQDREERDDGDRR